jgi:hypothetical protein
VISFDQSLADNTLIVYIRAHEDNESALIERARTHPKPLYYQQNFLQQQLKKAKLKTNK